ncbi:MAG: hypothetical protein IH955_03850 [Chloroflexi bacterium]|nr:hypothetical protein [Chloroflexota bacterium]
MLLVPALMGLLFLAAMACGNGDGATPTQAPSLSPSPTARPSLSDTPTPSPEAQGSFIQFSTEDCILNLSGELGERTTINQTYVENEPKVNIERLFQRFQQSASQSTILRCDMRTSGFFSTWWVQSLQTEEEAIQLFDAFVDATGPEVIKLNLNPLSCFRISARLDQDRTRYILDFQGRGLCEPDVFNGMSGLVLYKRTVIGVDSQFKDELFDIIIDRARQVVDQKSD